MWQGFVCFVIIFYMKNIIKNIIVVIAIILIGYVIYSAPKTDNTDSGRVMAPQENSVAVGETKEFMGGVYLTLNEVTDDYRCPIDVECIEGGAVNTNITLREGETTLNTFYSSDGVALNFNGYNVSIISVYPDLYAGSTVNKSDYVVTFRVESSYSGSVDTGDLFQTVPTGTNACENVGGTWDETNKECLGVDSSMCQEIGGMFDECASACRNDKNAEVCTMQCVQVCKIQ